MREDMDKLLVLRGRGGGRGRWRYGRNRHRSLEELPKREPMSRAWGTKWLGENFGPLVRFLERRVGRRWDDVYSEICARLDRSNAVQRHVFVHLEEFVKPAVTFVDGVPHDQYGHPIYFGRWSRFHVDADGVLRRNPHPARTLP